MSMPCGKTVSCPKCGAPIHFTMWETINTMIDTALPDIISGKLFDVECEACGYKTFVNYPMLFNDMINWVMIQYVFPQNKEEAVKTISEAFAEKGIRARLVTSQDELREKASIFNAGLDDRVIEIMKVLTLQMIEPQIAGKEVGHVFYVDNNGSPAMEFSLDGKHAFVELGMERYNIIMKMFENQKPDLVNEIVVDYDWAIKYLAEHNT